MRAHGGNVGITAFDARQSGHLAVRTTKCLITVANNFSSDDVDVPLVLRGSQGQLGQRRLRIPAGENRGTTFTHIFSSQEVLQAEIIFRDALATDNKAHLTAYPPTPTRVLLVGPGNYFLERGLRVFPRSGSSAACSILRVATTPLSYSIACQFRRASAVLPYTWLARWLIKPSVISPRQKSLGGIARIL
jgi:hypothetical protein